MDWLELLKIIGISICSSAGISCAIAWLSKSLFKFWFDKGLEKYKVDLARQMNFQLEVHKAKLNTAIETHKSKLKMDADEYQIRIDYELNRINNERSFVFSKLHAERAEVIKKFHTMLIEAESSFIKFVQIQSDAIWGRLDERYRNVTNCLCNMFNFYDENRIYLDINTCEMILELRKNIHEIMGGAGSISNMFIIDNSNTIISNYSEGNKLIIEGLWQQWREQIVMIQNNLENKFRKLLGVD
jgi:hypothetical protein